MPDHGSPPPSSGIHITGLTVEFGGRAVLDDLSLNVKRGEFITVLGNSGCGKTTLLRYIAGFVDARAGELWIGANRVTEVPPDHRNIGLVYQNYALFPHMTVFENVAFGLRARKVAESEIRERVAAALSSVRLDEFHGYRPAQLSGGMQQRVALARALVIKPDVLLLDEPVSALDANLRSTVRAEIKLMHRALPDLTVLYVTHDREDALVLSDRVVLLREGRVEQAGTPGELYDRPSNRFVAKYLGEANFLSPSLLRRVFPNGAFPAGDETGFYCIRPERLQLGGDGPGRVTAEVARSEWRGSSVRLDARIDGEAGDPIIVEVPRRGEMPREGEQISLSFAMEDCVHVSD